MPPTTAAILTMGGNFGVIKLSGVNRSSSAWTSFKHAFMCDDICNASSRVGARINARTGLRDFDSGWCLRERSLCRIGNPYARVLPDPCANVSVRGK